MTEQLLTETNGGATPLFSPGRVEAKALPKRFYKVASAGPSEAGFALLLDGRAARTPGRNPLVVPRRALADALVGEWAAVGETIDPRNMPLTRIVNTVIDGVSHRRDEVMAEVKRFAASDLLVYRAAEPHDLVRFQRNAWDPVIAWARDHLGAEFLVTQGVVHVAQPPETLRRLSVGLDALVGSDPDAPFRAGALHVMTTLTGSALLAAAVAAGRLTATEAWSAAHVDEDFQISRWGEDDEAMQRRAMRWTEMAAASDVFRLSAADNEAGGQCVKRRTK